MNGGMEEGVLRGFGGQPLKEEGTIIKVSCCNSLYELLGGGMIREWETGGSFYDLGGIQTWGPGAWSYGI